MSLQEASSRGGTIGVASALEALPPYRARIEPEWIDYNGHLRDAYYGVILSLAIDAVMDALGLDERYRQRTHCTLYTLEQHMIFQHEVKSSDELIVTTTVLDADIKRLHAGCRFQCARVSGAVATAEVMLLHVHQGASVASAAFPADIQTTLESFKAPDHERAAWAPASRAIGLKR